MVSRWALAVEVGSIRARDVDRVVSRKIDACQGECSTQQIEAWERDAYREWREQWPNLNSLLIPSSSDDALEAVDA